MRGWVARRAALAFSLPALLLSACLGYCGVPSEEVRMARSNTLDEVLGEAELLVPAERRPGFDYLSPNGRWLIVRFNQYTQWVLIDLPTMAEHPIELDCVSKNDISLPLADARWMEPTRFVIANAHAGCYYLVNAEDGISYQLPVVPEDEARLRSADPPLYITKSLGMGGFTAFALGDEPFVMHIGGSESTPPPWAAAIPHIEVPVRHHTITEPVYSSDGCFYVTGGNEVSIYGADDHLIAKARKTGWNHDILGWAHDDSGVYVRMTIGGGSDGAIFYPWEVLWKLKVPEGASCGAGE